MGFDMNQMMMNQQQQQQQQQLYGGYSQDGSQMGGLAGSMYADDSALTAGDDANDAKRRRIARVRMIDLLTICGHWLIGGFDNRLAICAGRKRSSATARCPSAHTVSTIKRIVFLPKSRRNEIPRKGESLLEGFARLNGSDWTMQCEVHRGLGKSTGPHGIAPPTVWPPLRR